MKTWLLTDWALCIIAFASLIRQTPSKFVILAYYASWSRQWQPRNGMSTLVTRIALWEIEGSEGYILLSKIDQVTISQETESKANIYLFCAVRLLFHLKASYFAYFKVLIMFFNYALNTIGVKVLIFERLYIPHISYVFYTAASNLRNQAQFLVLLSPSFQNALIGQADPVPKRVFKTLWWLPGVPGRLSMTQKNDPGSLVTTSMTLLYSPPSILRIPVDRTRKSLL